MKAIKVNRAVVTLVLTAVILSFGLFSTLSYRLNESILFGSILLSNHTDTLLPTENLAYFPVNQVKGDDPNLLAGSRVFSFALHTCSFELTTWLQTRATPRLTSMQTMEKKLRLVDLRI
jgi:hypothetical protein